MSINAKEETKLDDLEVLEISSLNVAPMDIEELEARLEVATLVPNDDCWYDNHCSCGIDCVPS